MFDFIKNLFKKAPQAEQIIEVEVAVKPKRKYKPRAPKTEVNVEVVAEPVVETEVEKEPAKKKPTIKKPVVAAAVETKIEQAVVSSVPKKPENKPKAPQNKPPRGRKKK
jgi:hypothetical protein